MVLVIPVQQIPVLRHRPSQRNRVPPSYVLRLNQQIDTHGPFHITPGVA
jgi:hypothetical protein